MLKSEIHNKIYRYTIDSIYYLYSTLFFLTVYEYRKFFNAEYDIIIDNNISGEYLE